MNVKLKIISSLLVSFYTIGCSIDASILNLNRLVGGGGTDESVIAVPDSPFYQGDAWNGKVSALSETTESVSYYRPLLVNLGDGSLLNMSWTETMARGASNVLPMNVSGQSYLMVVQDTFSESLKTLLGGSPVNGVAVYSTADLDSAVYGVNAYINVISNSSALSSSSPTAKYFNQSFAHLTNGACAVVSASSSKSVYSLGTNGVLTKVNNDFSTFGASHFPNMSVVQNGRIYIKTNSSSGLFYLYEIDENCNTTTLQSISSNNEDSSIPFVVDGVVHWIYTNGNMSTSYLKNTMGENTELGSLVWWDTTTSSSKIGNGVMSTDLVTKDLSHIFSYDQNYLYYIDGDVIKVVGRTLSGGKYPVNTVTDGRYIAYTGLYRIGSASGVSRMMAMGVVADGTQELVGISTPGMTLEVFPLAEQVTTYSDDNFFSMYNLPQIKVINDSIFLVTGAYDSENQLRRYTINGSGVVSASQICFGSCTTENPRYLMSSGNNLYYLADLKTNGQTSLYRYVSTSSSHVKIDVMTENDFLFHKKVIVNSLIKSKEYLNRFLMDIINVDGQDVISMHGNKTLEYKEQSVSGVSAMSTAIKLPYAVGQTVSTAIANDRISGYMLVGSHDGSQVYKFFGPKGYQFYRLSGSAVEQLTNKVDGVGYLIQNLAVINQNKLYFSDIRESNEFTYVGGQLYSLDLNTKQTSEIKYQGVSLSNAHSLDYIKTKNGQEFLILVADVAGHGSGIYKVDSQGVVTQIPQAYELYQSQLKTNSVLALMPFSKVAKDDDGNLYVMKKSGSTSDSDIYKIDAASSSPTVEKIFSDFYASMSLAVDKVWLHGDDFAELTLNVKKIGGKNHLLFRETTGLKGLDISDSDNVISIPKIITRYVESSSGSTVEYADGTASYVSAEGVAQNIVPANLASGETQQIAGVSYFSNGKLYTEVTVLEGADLNNGNVATYILERSFTAQGQSNRRLVKMLDLDEIKTKTDLTHQDLVTMFLSSMELSVLFPNLYVSRSYGPDKIIYLAKDFVSSNRNIPEVRIYGVSTVTENPTKELLTTVPRKEVTVLEGVTVEATPFLTSFLDLAGVEKLRKQGINVNGLPKGGAMFMITYMVGDMAKMMANEDQGFKPYLITELLHYEGGVVTKISSINTQVDQAVMMFATGQCFIATAAFGTNLDQHINILREFRGSVLMNSEFGRSFVKFYYTHAPEWAKYVAASPVLKESVRVALFPVIGISYLWLNYGAWAVLIVLSVLTGLGYLTYTQLRKGKARLS